MLRVVVAATALVALAACNANLEGGCLGGVCADPDAGLGGAGGASTASGSGGACVAGTATADFPCDVFHVVRRQCNPCHQSPPKMGAPFSLLTYEATQAPYQPGGTTVKNPNGTVKLIFEQMHDQIQPGALPQMPFMRTPMPAADFATINTWLEQCETLRGQGKGCGCPGDLCK